MTDLRNRYREVFIHSIPHNDMDVLRSGPSASTVNPVNEDGMPVGAQVPVHRKQPRRVQNEQQIFFNDGMELRYPLGLGNLAKMDEVYLHQIVDKIKLMMLSNSPIDVHVANGFSVGNRRGQRCYAAYEESEYCNRMWCGPNRGFEMHVTQNDGREVIRCTREFKCCAGCCWCADGNHCGWVMKVEAPRGNLIGHIRQHGSKWKTNITLYDVYNQELYDIWSKCCPFFCICCSDEINFHVHDAKPGTPSRPRIYRKWDGCCTTADLLVCEFPGMEVEEKALFICACFMIETMVFERLKWNSY